MILLILNAQLFRHSEKFDWASRYSFWIWLCNRLHFNHSIHAFVLIDPYIYSAGNVAAFDMSNPDSVVSPGGVVTPSSLSLPTHSLSSRFLLHYLQGL